MSDFPPDLASVLADRYELLRELGAGGMATVYLARDVRHNRQVALKVLLPELSAVLGPERFLREIELTASLQHPHILPLFDSGEAGGRLFYVMPYVEGETLRGRLERETQLPVDDAIGLAREIADALQYAHERGVIHRDIKPENILLQGGPGNQHALVADFGIALAVQQAGGTRMTQTGLSLGTPAYMAPEQAMGDRTVDARADIYALGAVTYEMLAGEAPFTGPTSQAIVARVLTAAPAPLTATRSTVPRDVERTVLDALAKLPADRPRTARAFADGLVADRGRGETRPAEAPPIRRRKRLRRTGAYLVAALLGVAVGRAWSGAARPPESPARFSFTALAAASDESWIADGDAYAVSPDGRLIVVRSRRADGTALVLHSLDSAGPRRLPHTADATYPFFSPDSRSLAYFARGALRILDLTTGAAITRCPAAWPSGGGWGANGTILYIPQIGGPIHRTSSTGPCTPLPVVLPRLGGGISFLSDGRRFIYAPPGTAYLGWIDRDSLVPLTQTAGRAVVFGDELLYRESTDGAVFARRIDPSNDALTGPATPLVEGLVAPFGRSSMAASPAGTFVAFTRVDGEGGTGGRRTVHVLPGGRIARRATAGGWSAPEPSSNGTQLVVGGFGVRLFDVRRGEWTEIVPPIGFTQGASGTAWLPGDTLVSFVRWNETDSMFTVDVRSGALRLLFVPPGAHRASTMGSWTRDGRVLTFGRSAGEDADWAEAWWFDAEENRVQRAFTEAAHIEHPVIAPDGRWLAYRRSTAGGTDVGIFIRRFPGPAVAIPAVRGDVDWPRWSHDGRTLYFRRGGRAIEAVTVSATGEIGPPRVVVPSATLDTLQPDFGDVRFSVGTDTDEFWATLTDDRARSLLVIQNLDALLAQRRREAQK